MSSLLSRNKDPIRTRKSLFDSPSNSPAANVKDHRHERVSRLDSSGAPEASKDRALNQAESSPQRENRLSARKKTEEEMGCRGYKKMYEEALNTNERLKTRLAARKQELTVLQVQLEKLTQLKRRPADCRFSVLETEKKERRRLEKRISDMEEELKAKKDLSVENQRLKDENGALIRVISKLSK